MDPKSTLPSKPWALSACGSGRCGFSVSSRWGLHAATGTGTLAASLAGAGLPSAGLGLGLGPRVQGVLGVIRDVAALSSFRLLKSAGNYTRSSPS